MPGPSAAVAAHADAVAKPVHKRSWMSIGPVEPRRRLIRILTTTTAAPFHDHYTGQPALAGTSS